MLPKSMIRDLPEDWMAFLSDIDHGLEEPVRLECLGGFVAVCVYGLPRYTADLDYVAAAPGNMMVRLEELAGRGSELYHRHKRYLQFTGILDLPEDYEERLLSLRFPELSKLHLDVLEIYDLILSKLTRNSPKDRHDVEALARTHRLNRSTLTARFEKEMKPWIPNVSRHELTLQLWGEAFEP
jgi:hypothetical protein